MGLLRALPWPGVDSLVHSPPHKAGRGIAFGLAATTVVAGLLLGGGTRPGFLSDAILQLIAVPVLLATLWLMRDRFASQLLWAQSFCLALVALPLIQLIPLSPSVWTALPGHQVIASNLSLIDQELPSMPISVSPNATWLALLALLPPFAVFLTTIQLGHQARRRLSLLVLGFASLSVFLGLVQVAQGPSSALRFFSYTNPTEAVGFFANRNHYSALLYSAMLLATAWAVTMSQAPALKSKTTDSKHIVALVACFTILVLLVAAQLIARSRAGLGLTIIALFGTIALAIPDRRSGVFMDGHRTGALITPRKLVVGATTLALMFAAQFALYRVQERFTADPLADARWPFARNTIEAAWAYMPFGSGLGTFVPVYALFEKPEDTLANRYANHAHNDFLELWLETGVLGLVVLAIFLAWFYARASKIWLHPPQSGQAIDTALARAATLIIAFLIAHSFVDYPLRTSAMACVFAFACALLIAPPDGVAEEPEGVSRDVCVRGGENKRPWPRAQHRDANMRRHAHAPGPASTGVPPVPPVMDKCPKPARRWGEDENIEWPEAWRTTETDQPSHAKRQAPRSGKPKQV